MIVYEPMHHKKEKYIVMCDSCFINGKEIYYTRWHDSRKTSLKNNGIDLCDACLKKKYNTRPIYNGEDVYLFFIEKGLIPLFSPSDYKTSEGNLPFSCPDHMEKEIQYTSYYKLRKQKTYKCKYCANSNMGSNRVARDYVLETFQKHNIEILFNKEDITGVKQKLPYICLYHEEKGILYRSCDEMAKASLPCSYCADEARSGENHPFWNGGITPLRLILRATIINWITDSRKYWKHKCCITGETYIHIHHIIPFENIIADAIKIYGNDEEARYLKDNLENMIKIKEYVLSKHFAMGCGIAFGEEVHKLFHRVYGKTFNGIDNIIEFIDDFKNGIYYEFLNEKNLILCINPDVYNYVEEIKKKIIQTYGEP